MTMPEFHFTREAEEPLLPLEQAAPRWRGSRGGAYWPREEIEAVIACLGDDAATLRAENDEDERATNMDRAASMLQVFAIEIHGSAAGAAGGEGDTTAATARPGEPVAARLDDLMRRCREDRHVVTYQDLLQVAGELGQQLTDIHGPIAFPPTKALQDVAAERQRQVHAEGWTAKALDGTAHY